MTVFNEAYLIPHCIEKADGGVPSGDDDLFTISGGTIKVLDFYGLVSVEIGANATNCLIQHACTAPAADIALSTAVAVATDAVGTTYYISSASPGVFTPVTAGSIIQATQMLPWLLTPGSLQANFSGVANTGNIRWFMFFKPLSPKSLVVVAA